MLVFILIAAIVFIVLATSRFKVHPFFALLLASYAVAFAAGLPARDIAATISDGFGGILRSIGLVIILGTLIGTLLEKTGAAIKLADVVLRVVGEKRPALAMSIIGYIVSIPVFCDSAFVILSSMKKAIARKTGQSGITMSIALATGLYATHTLVPPTPGPIAAAGNLGLTDRLGLVILLGLFVSIPAMLAGYVFARFAGGRDWAVGEESNGQKTSQFAEAGDGLTKTGEQPETFGQEGIQTTAEEEAGEDDDVRNQAVTTVSDGVAAFNKFPSAFAALTPILLPICLIALGSIANFPGSLFGGGLIHQIFNFLGQPLNALLVGFLVSLALLPGLNRNTLNEWVGEGLKSAALILMITGAGGAFGAVLKATQIGDQLGEMLSGWNLGIFLPFVIAAAMKTAQGSSTVALVTTSALVAPLLGGLGLDSTIGRVLAVMAVGAGAMTVSHANDSYFWVVSQFSDLDVKTAYKTQTVATGIQGFIAIVVVFLLSLVLE